MNASVRLLVFYSPVRAAQSIQADVCVYGGGAGGITAAIQAARLGKSVAILVFNNHLGGMTTSGLGVTDVGLNGNAYIQGLAREFYTRVGAKYGQTVATYSFEPHIAEQVFNEMIQQAGVSVYYDEQLAATTMSGTRISELTMVNGDVVQAKEFVDASYEGDLLKQAGVSYTVGRESTAQYGENLAGIRGTNASFLLKSIDPYVTPGDPTSGLLPGVNATDGGAAGSADDKVQAYCYRMCLTRNVSNRVQVSQPSGYNPADYDLLIRAIAGGQTGGFWSAGSIPNDKTDSNNQAGVSTDFVGMNQAYPEADYATRAQIALAQKNWQLGLIWTVQNDPRVPLAIRTAWAPWGLAADEFTDNGNWPPQLYVREARRMISDYVMTEQNCLGYIAVADPVGLGSYTLDSHDVQRFVSHGIVQNEGGFGVTVSEPYSISYRSLVPMSGQCSNLLVPWCLSASHVAFASIRSEPVYMILGQAAGTAASVAIDDDVDVQNVPYPALKAQLLAEGQALETGPTVDSWKRNNFTLAQLENSTYSGDTADPAHDGLPNLLKAFFNRNPNVPTGTATSVMGITTIGGSNYLTCTYSRFELGNLTGTVEVTSQLGDSTSWVSGPAFVESTVTSDNGVMQTIVARDLQPISPTTPRFMRISVKRAP